MSLFARHARRPLWLRALSFSLALVLTYVVHTLVAAHTPGLSLADNSFLFADWLCMEGLDRLLNVLELSSYGNTDYNKEFKKPFPVGDSVRVKYPQRYIVRDGMGYTPQPLSRVFTTVNVNQPFGIDFEYDSLELALKMERGKEAIRKEYIEPAFDQIAQEIESRFALFAYQNTPNIVGVLGTDPTSFQTLNQARQRMVELACPAGDKGMFIPPAVNTALVNAGISYMNPQKDISDQFRKGYLGVSNGFKCYESMSLYTHTAGTWAGAVTVNGAGQSGSSLTITATAGDTFKKGDVVGLGGIFPVNPSTRRRTQSATTMQVAITQDLTAVGGGVDVVQITPALFGPGSQYQNVDALPANAAALTLFPGTSSPNGKSGVNALGINRNAFAIVGVELENPKSSMVDMVAQQRDPETGIAVALIRDFDTRLRKWITRLDIVLGFGILYNQSCSVRLLCA